MHTVAFIPARYGSTRFKGKPLADICGKPMIWWVYHQVIKTKGINDTYVLTDSTEIEKVCKRFSMPCIITSGKHETGTERIFEAAGKIKADVYVCVNGDEPLIKPETIEKVLPGRKEDFFAANLMAKISSPAEVVDNTNIKVVTDAHGNALFMSRSPIPYPKGDIEIEYKKHLGVLAYSYDALDFFANTKKGSSEQAEEINELRFLEHGKKLKMVLVDSDTLSVDTPKDLSYVTKVIQKKINNGEMIV